jgi:hypothetical protein
VTDNSDDDGRPFRRIAYTRTRTNPPASHSNRSTSVRGIDFWLDDAIRREMLAELKADVLTRLPTPCDSLSPIFSPKSVVSRTKELSTVCT